MRIISPKRLLESVAPTVRNGSIFNASSLDLQFARTKTLDPRITFTRASSGTYVGSDGLIKTATTNEARFDHNPTTGESLGLLVEEQRTNSFTNSEAFGSWGTATRCSVSSNTIAAPDGQTTADTLIEDNTASNTHELINTAGVAFTSGTAYTFTVFAKSKERSQLTLFLPSAAFGSGTAQQVLFNLSTATATTTTGSPTAFSITPFANDWYRCSVTATATATTTSSVRIRLAFGGLTTYSGDNTSGLYIWGAQLEAGAFPTSYIPTTTATVTRSADVASITGANFSSWYNQTEGTVFVEGRSPATSASYLAFSDNSSNNRILYDTISTGTSRRLVVTSGGAQQAALNHTGGVEQMLKSSFVYKADDFIACTSSALSSADTSGTVPTVDRMYVGSNASGALPTNGVLRRLTYWPSRLPNATLQQITR